jgi:hypothetical protein
MVANLDQEGNGGRRYYLRRWLCVSIFLLITFTVILLALGTIRSRGLQCRSPEQITKTLLEATPRGTNRQVVRRFVDARGWRRGGLIRSASPDEDPVDRISVYVGKAEGLFWDEKVFAEWVFDTEDKLIDVWVYKITLGP